MNPLEVDPDTRRMDFVVFKQLGVQVTENRLTIIEQPRFVVFPIVLRRHPSDSVRIQSGGHIAKTFTSWLLV